MTHTTANQVESKFFDKNSIKFFLIFLASALISVIAFRLQIHPLASVDHKLILQLLEPFRTLHLSILKLIAFPVIFSIIVLTFIAPVFLGICFLLFALRPSWLPQIRVVPALIGLILVPAQFFMLLFFVDRFFAV
jgi:hypothetical protein